MFVALTSWYVITLHHLSPLKLGLTCASSGPRFKGSDTDSAPNPLPVLRAPQECSNFFPPWGYHPRRPPRLHSLADARSTSPESSQPSPCWCSVARRALPAHRELLLVKGAQGMPAQGRCDTDPGCLRLDTSRSPRSGFARRG